MEPKSEFSCYKLCIQNYESCLKIVNLYITENINKLLRRIKFDWKLNVFFKKPNIVKKKIFAIRIKQLNFKKY